MCAIAKKIGISRHTVKRYLDPNFSATHGKYGSYQGGPLTPHHNKINDLLKKMVILDLLLL